MRLAHALEATLGFALLAVPAMRLLAPHPVPTTLDGWTEAPNRSWLAPDRATVEVVVNVQDGDGVPVSDLAVVGARHGQWTQLGVTDAAGAAVIEVPQEIEEISVWAPRTVGYRAYTPQVGPRVLNFWVFRRCKRTLTLLHADGTPASGAEVEFEVGPDATSTQRADEAGVWSGEVGCEVPVTVRAAGHGSATWWPDGPSPFTLPRTATIDLHVLRHDGTPAAGATGVALSRAYDIDRKPDAFTADESGHAEVLVNADSWSHLFAGHADGDAGTTIVWHFGRDRNATLWLHPYPADTTRDVHLADASDLVHADGYCVEVGASLLSAHDLPTCSRRRSIAYANGRAYEIPAGGDVTLQPDEPPLRYQGTGAAPYAYVYAWPWPPSRARSTEPWMVEATADLTGAYELVGLSPGRWRISTQPRQRRTSLRDEIARDQATSWVAHPGTVVDVDIPGP
jgi:hypothetical protein